VLMPNRPSGGGPQWFARGYCSSAARTADKDWAGRSDQAMAPAQAARAERRAWSRLTGLFLTGTFGAPAGPIAGRAA